MGDLSNVLTSFRTSANKPILDTTELKNASTEAFKLGKILQSSFNSDTNKLDLTKLNR